MHPQRYLVGTGPPADHDTGVQIRKDHPDSTLARPSRGTLIGTVTFAWVPHYRSRHAFELDNHQPWGGVGIAGQPIVGRNRRPRRPYLRPGSGRPPTGLGQLAGTPPHLPLMQARSGRYRRRSATDCHSSRDVMRPLSKD